MTEYDEHPGEISPFGKIALAYAAQGFKVFPVWEMVKHRQTGELECGCMRWKRKQAKDYGEEATPCDKPGKHSRGIDSWKKRATTDAEIIKNWARKFPNANIGIATGEQSGLLVIDLDGDDGICAWEALLAANSQIDDTVTVRTGSGGRHIWFAYPEGADLTISASTIAPKIDMRGEGGYIVVPPSIHKSGNRYEFLEGCSPHDLVVAQAPAWLIQACGKKGKAKPGPKENKTKQKPGSDGKRDEAKSGQGQSEHEHGFDDYLRLIGDAEGQEGFHAPIYRAACSFFARSGAHADAAPLKAALLAAIEVAQKDPSRSRDKYFTDEYLDVRIEEAREFIAASHVAADEESPAERYEFDDKVELVQAINRNFALITVGSGTRFLRQRGPEFDLLLKTACQDILRPYKYLIVSNGQVTGTIPAFNIWLESPKRREYPRGIVFEPGKETPGAFNLWKGFCIEPRQGDWSLFRKHLWEVICKKDDVLFHWLLAWMAQSVQEPGNKPGTSIVLTGKQGTGKTTFGRWLGRPFGDHAVTASHPNHIVGNFNAHMEACVLLLAEEAFWAGDAAAEGVLKDLITGEKRLLERKGVDPIQVPNHVRLIVTTNSRWAVPAVPGQRRFFVLEVSDAYAKDTEYFGALENEFQNGGPEAMLYDLLRLDYSQINLREPPPTDALSEQIEHSFKGEMRWWHAVLTEGNFPDDTGAPFLSQDDADKWLKAKLTIERKAVQDSYKAYVPGTRGRPTTAVDVGKFLNKVIPELGDARQNGKQKTRTRQYVLPALTELREAFTNEHGITFDAFEAEEETGESQGEGAALVAANVVTQAPAGSAAISNGLH